MDDLTARFDRAVAASKQLPDKPDNMTLLRLYALYKQASGGDADPGTRPGITDFVGRAKWDAWDALRGKSMPDSRQEYIELVESLQ